MNQREYAEHRGCSQQNIAQFKKQGRLVLDASGKIDVAASDALLQQVLDPARGGDRRPEEREKQLIDIASYQDAATLEKLERVRLLRLQADELAGSLVRQKDVETEAFQRARQAQESLMAIPDRIAGRLAAETDANQVHALLDAELRLVIEQICDAAVESQAAEESA